METVITQDKLQCTQCKKDITNGQEFARMKINGQYFYFHNRFHTISDCYGNYLLQHLLDTKGVQAT